MTTIEWTDATWNPVTGCTKVSQGCKHCYAERVFPRAYKKTGRRFTDVRTHAERLNQPLHWRTPRRIFVNSMSDLFHEDVPVQFIADVFAFMAYARHHTFQVLTKRPNRMLELLTSPHWIDDLYDGATALAHDEACEILGRRGEFDPNARRTDDIRAFDSSLPLANVWLGVSVEDQATADERIPLLLQTPAKVRWISAEPLLEPVQLSRWMPCSMGDVDTCPNVPLTCCQCDDRRSSNDGLNWVVVGGESGPKARPFDFDWARSLRHQCGAAGVPFFLKQIGTDHAALYERVRKDRKGGDPSEWPEDLRVRQWPDEPSW